MLEFDLLYDLSPSNLLYMIEAGRKAETSSGFKPRWSFCNRKTNKQQTQHLSVWGLGFFLQEVYVEPKFEFAAGN